MTACRVAILWVLSGLAGQVSAQMLKPAPIPAVPTSPPSRTVADARYGVAFHLPAAWNLTRRDGEISTFHLDARSAPSSAELRAVAAIAYNPYPLSTFSGALFYFSVAPGGTEAECAAQASLPLHLPDTKAQIAGATFTHGHDEHGGICIEARDEVYTSYRRHACYRFDLAMNSFCGGEVSGARDMTKAEMDDIRGREEGILNTLALKP